MKATDQIFFCKLVTIARLFLREQKDQNLLQSKINVAESNFTEQKRHKVKMGRCSFINKSQTGKQ